jgi:aspartyl aminopeptidase
MPAKPGSRRPPRKPGHDFRAAAQSLLDFIAASPTPFHAVGSAADSLHAAGFTDLEEGDPWPCEPGGRYRVTRNGSSLAAFVPGTEPPVEAGFRIIGAHTDSPSLRLKPHPVIQHHGYLQLGVEVYGKPILASWVDRDLGLAGRVMLSGPGGSLERRLLRIDRPIARVPEVAIHLDRDVNEKGLHLNEETQLPPVFGLFSDDWWDFHGWLAQELGVAPERILDQDLTLYDLTPPSFLGLQGEFVSASRLDNLAGCHAALEAFLAAAATPNAATRVIVLYDNEEIGSNTRQGASSPFLDELLSRIVTAWPGEKVGARATAGRSGTSEGGGRRSDPESLFRARARSWFVSSDMAHAVHPNYAERHEARHMPVFNGGPVIKYNANARYATDAESGAYFQAICLEADVPCQKFVMRADMACGSTIGPLVSTRLGIRTVDVGSCMLAMHSCREMAGSQDPLYMTRAMSRFYSR